MRMQMQIVKKTCEYSHLRMRMQIFGPSLAYINAVPNSENNIYNNYIYIYIIYICIRLFLYVSPETINCTFFLSVSPCKVLYSWKEFPFIFLYKNVLK